ncbi:MAG: GntR family transcriptional regulator [Paracoccaceae bacterium]|nr:GntR family transcriptional regulator [Paracoccaceae bacterium]
MPRTQQRRTPRSAESSFKVTENLSLTDRATRVVRDRILDLTLSPGMALDERYLLERFEFGRTPMREALNRLIVEGLVVSREPRGMQVAPLSIDSTIELFDAYVLSERMVASVLRFDDPDLLGDLERLHADYVKNLDETGLLRVTELNAWFHYRLAAATQNAHITAYSHKLHNVARRLSYFIFKREAANGGLVTKLFEKPRQDHERIVDSIRHADRDALIEILTDHAKFFRTRLARIISEDNRSDIDFSGLSGQG